MTKTITDRKAKLTEVTDDVWILDTTSGMTHNGHTFEIVGVWKDQVDIQFVPPKGKYISAYSASDGFTTFRVTSHQQFNLEHLYWHLNSLIEETSLISAH